MYISSHGKEHMINMEYLIVAGYSECTQGMDQTGNTAANSIEKSKNMQNTYPSNSFFLIKLFISHQIIWVYTIFILICYPIL